MTTEEKLIHFAEVSLEQARTQSNQILMEHQASLDKLEEEHIAGKKRQAALKVKTEYSRLKRAENVALSKAKIEIKRDFFKKHNELKEKLIVEITSLLEYFMTTPEYSKLLIKQIQGITDFAGDSPVTIYIDSIDSHLITSLSTLAGTPLKTATETFFGGTKAIIEDRHILIDNSFSTLLAETMAAFRFDGGGKSE